MRNLPFLIQHLRTASAEGNLFSKASGMLWLRIKQFSGEDSDILYIKYSRQG